MVCHLGSLNLGNLSKGQGRQTKIGDKIRSSAAISRSFRCIRQTLRNTISFSDWEKIFPGSMTPPKRGKFPKTSHIMMRHCLLDHPFRWVYGQNAMSDSMVRRWVRQFNEGRSEVHDDERSGRPSLITEELVHAIDEKIKENRKFTISALAMEFPQISRSIMHEIVTDKMKFHKLCALWVPKILTDSHKTKRMGCALEFLTRYHEGGVDFLSQIVTGDETWVSLMTPLKQCKGYRAEAELQYLEGVRRLFWMALFGLFNVQQ
ncbi:histone-lysine N-methyltransferase SETMAR [Trichonephila clavipes]|nr:histone-lysine N-methyltransferase SETMAR [Trichonephila clavipes]